MVYRVAYLVHAKRTWADPKFESIDRAIRYMKALKSRGLTAWVEDEHGNFIPVHGAKRKPAHL